MLTRKRKPFDKYVHVSCDSCDVLVINNIVCHETGCPDSWRDKKKVCFTCGFDFKPEDRYQSNCQDCINDAENGGI
jgi:hypothetical protein